MDVVNPRTLLRVLIVGALALCAGIGAYALGAGATRASGRSASRVSGGATAPVVEWVSPRDGTIVRRDPQGLRLRRQRPRHKADHEGHLWS